MNEESVAVSEIRENVLLQSEHFALVLILVSISNVRAFQVLGGWILNQSWPFGASLDRASDSRKDSLGCKEIHTAVDKVGDM